jgi:hypothetical protein
MTAEIRNRLPQRFQVEIEPGTYFVAAGGHQDMVVIEKYQLDLPPYSSQRVELNVACIRAWRSIPGQSDRFEGVARMSADIVQFLEAGSPRDFCVIQAGVWALSDQFSRTDIQQRLILPDVRGRTVPAIEDAQIDEAARILDGLGIGHGLGTLVPSSKKGGGHGEDGGLPHIAPPLMVLPDSPRRKRDSAPFVGGPWVKGPERGPRSRSDRARL